MSTGDLAAPLRVPAYRSFLAGRVLSTLARQTLGVAVGWQVYAITGSALDLGLVGLVQFLPHLVLFPVAGAIVDRADRSRVLQGCYIGQGLAGALLAAQAVANPSVNGIFATLLLLAVSRIFTGPAGSATLPRLVPADDYPRAVSWNSAAFTASTVTGPALAGVVYGLAESQGCNGAFAAYALAAVLSLGAFATSLTLPTIRVERPAPTRPIEDALDGLRYIFGNGIVLGAITLDLFAVLFGGAVALLPIYASVVLHTGPEGLGILRAAPAVGALGMALLLGVRPVTRRIGRTLLVAVAIFGVSTLAFALSESFWLSVLALAVSGAADEVSVFIRVNVVQMATPDHLRGRVSAAEFVFVGASNELGELESGLAASWLGVVPAAALGAVGTLVVVAVTSMVAKRLRSIDTVAELMEEGRG